MRTFLLFVFAVLLGFSSVQAAPIGNVDDVGDVFVPGPKTAGADDAWSLFHNPAGLAFVDGAQLVGGYAYRLRLNKDGLHQGQGALALSFFEWITASIGLQLALPPTQEGADKGIIVGSFGGAFRISHLISFGVRLAKQRQYAKSASDPFWFSLGVETFPFSWLSLGANFNQSFENIASWPEIRAGIATKLFGDQFTIGLESRFRPDNSGANARYAFHPELVTRVNVGGFSLLASARVDDIGQGFSTPTLFAGIEFNFDHLGFGVVAEGRPSELLNAGGRFRLSSEAWHTLAKSRYDDPSDIPVSPHSSPMVFGMPLRTASVMGVDAITSSLKETL